MMVRRFGWMWAAAAVVAMAPLPAAAQSSNYRAPRTAWGEPDLQGQWPSTNLNFQVPMERPVAMGERSTLTDEEYEERAQQARDRAQADSEQFAKEGSNVGLGPPGYWVERGAPVRQTSLVVDPPNGRIPELTSNAKELDAARTAKFNQTYHVDRKVHGSNHLWIDDVLALVEPAEHNLYVRCISRGIMGSITPSGYNNGVRITQSPGYIVIEYEMIHEARMIPTDGRPHVDSRIRSFMGDPVAHWEGDTLVVETTNFIGDQNGITGNGGGYPYSKSLKVTERFTRVSDRVIQYEGTMDDPETWTAPWTVAFPLERDDEYIWSEYACHEGNYALHDILEGAAADIEAAKNGERLENR